MQLYVLLMMGEDSTETCRAMFQK